MGRKKKVVIEDETLSKENEKVQEELLEDSIEEPAKGAEVKEVIVEEFVTPDEVKKTEEPKVLKSEVLKPEVRELKVGDRVKIKPNVETDTLGRRIHNGIRNYTYTILAVRPDGFISIECLTYTFLVRKDQVNRI